MACAPVAAAGGPARAGCTTAVLPERYTMRLWPRTRSRSYCLRIRRTCPPSSGGPGKRAKEMALVQRIQGASRDTELEDKLGQVQTQTLVVFGTADKVVPPAMGRTYRERMPNCHFVMVYDAGHAVATERPEALSNTIADFLDCARRLSSAVGWSHQSVEHGGSERVNSRSGSHTAVPGPTSMGGFRPLFHANILRAGLTYGSCSLLVNAR